MRKMDEPIGTTESSNEEVRRADRERARELARRYRCELVDLRDVYLDVDLLREALDLPDNLGLVKPSTVSMPSRGVLNRRPSNDPNKQFSANKQR